METPTQTLPPPAEPSPAPTQRKIHSAQLVTAMLKASPHVSDLIFSPGRAPQIEVGGQLVELKYKGLECLTSQDTNLIANDIMGKNETPIRKLEQEGSADLSYGLAGVARFRVNVFRQRGSCAIVMRVIPDKIPGFAELNLPAALGEIVDLRNGIVLVTGPTGSGKSSTLAAILDKMNEEKPYHILTIEDPIEFLHRHKKATIHQRELHSDTPSFALALRAALRQAPKVILVGEMRDRETIEIALEAAETGHLVLSTLHTIDASKTVERIVGVFPLGDQQAIRRRLGKAFRFIVSQRCRRDPEVHNAHARIHRKGRSRRQDPSGCHARWHHRRYAALRRRNRKADSGRGCRIRDVHVLCDERRKLAAGNGRFSRRARYRHTVRRLRRIYGDRDRTLGKSGRALSRKNRLSCSGPEPHAVALNRRLSLR